MVLGAILRPPAISAMLPLCVSQAFLMNEGAEATPFSGNPISNMFLRRHATLGGTGASSTKARPDEGPEYAIFRPTTLKK